MDPTDVDRRTVLRTVGAATLASGAVPTVTARKGGLKRELAEVRSATAAYNDPANAYGAGYFVPTEDENGDPVPMPLEDIVDEAHSVCGMGFHFVNPDHFGSVDRTEPPVLAYGVDDDDNLVLGAVEYVVPKAEPYEEAPPDLFEHDDGAEHWQEDSPQDGVWSLHVWVHIKNPAGVFSPFNPRKQFHPEGCIGPPSHDH